MVFVIGIGIGIGKVRYKLPEWCLHNICFVFVYPYISYGLEIYSNIYVTYLNKLTTLNNKFLCVLQRKSPRCCTTCFYTQYNTLPPAQLFTCHVINLVYKVLYSPFVLPSTFQQYFVLSNSIHQCRTRYNKLSVPQPVSRFGRRSLKFKGPQFSNRLPNELTDITSSNSFSKTLKYIFDL